MTKMRFSILLALLALCGPTVAAQRGGGRGNRSTPRPTVSTPRQFSHSSSRSASRPATRQGSVRRSAPAHRYHYPARRSYVRPYRSYPSYYPSYSYPSYGYGYYGVGVGIGYGGYGGYGYAVPITGIRFNMDLIPKNDRKVVERGIVTVDGSEVGIVDRFNSWQNGHVPVAPGDHQVVVQLEDGRVFQTETSIGTGEIRHIYIRCKNGGGR